MNILVIGSGGREHAVVKSLGQSQHVQKIFSAPGNAGTASISENVALNLQNHDDIIRFCHLQKIDLVFIGPEQPLVEGLCDSLRSAGIQTFGPSREAAQLEGSKIFAKEFMREAGVPTARAETVDSVDSTLKAAAQYTAPYILKADGLAAGKGVFICADRDELRQAATDLFNKKILGDAGCRALLEQNLPGQEISFLILTNGADFQALPLAQDHKRLRDDNQGPNTGGMGTVAPMNISAELYNKIITRVVKPSVAELHRRNYLFRGVLFIGLMIVDGEPYVLEYNVRFGDPETQVVLPLIRNDVALLFAKLSQGELEKVDFNHHTAFCIVNAAPGYPGEIQKNVPIQLPQETADSYILHAGTRCGPDGELLSAGGRVLNVVAVAPTHDQAAEMAYTLNKKINFEGRQFRQDIGKYRSLIR